MRGVAIAVWLLADLCCASVPVTVLDLNGVWNAQNSNGSVTVASRVPGGIYTDLLRAGLIGDPYYRDNDVQLKWIGRDDWTFNRTFDVSEDLLQKSRVQLVCHGLDTVSKIYVNDVEVGETDNMFVRYTFDIKDALKTGENRISVSFRSAVKVALERHLEQLKKYVVPPTCPMPIQNGECHVNYLRKIQSSFSWDWGPSFPTQGIWKNISIEAFDSAVLRDVTVTPRLYRHGPGDSNSEHFSWNLWVRLFLESAAPTVSGHVMVTLAGQQPGDLNLTLNATDEETGVLLRVPLPEDFKPELWWPAGYGAQPLYDLTVTFEDFASGERTSKKLRVGFRTVELVQDPVTNSTGLTFYARVNGVAIFAKGSNWIPADSFPERVTEDYLRLLLGSAVQANMNMLRVWGGGMYEQDAFYDLADQMGILIWQDIMFAVALYPVDRPFLDSVALEVRQQVRRLQHHPSIFCWAGNNENEAGIVEGWWPAVRQRSQQYREDYVQLYINTVRPVVLQEDPDRPFLSSSPSNGLETERQGWISSNPQDELFGDVHYYNYISDGWNSAIYPTPRFASEYGFQSYPSLKSLKKVLLPSDLYYPHGHYVHHRQHHIFGEFVLQFAIKRHTSLPRSGQEQALKDFIYLTQITQAMSLKTESEHYRRSRSTVVDGKGLTMGALYWQLNDIWQAPTWASIEYGGKWKMLHYFARNFFSPLLVSPYLDQNVVRVYIISDLLQDQEDLLLQVLVFKWDSLVPACVVQVTNYTQPPQSALEVYASPLWGEEGLMMKGSCKELTECYVVAQLVDPAGHLISENVLFLSPFGQAVGLTRASVQVTNVTETGSNVFAVTLTTSGVAPFVWLESPDLEGEFSDNGFLLYQPKRQVLFYPRNQTTAQHVRDTVEVRSLMDVQV